MNIPFINAIRSYLQGDGAGILPEMELVLFGLGILLIDFWIERKEKYWNAGLALAGTIFSAFTIWKLRGAVAARGDFAGFHDSVLVDPFFLFFATLFLAATALVILLSVQYLEIEREQEGEYYVLLLFACVGMMLMASGIDLIVMFLGLETMALSFYVLTGFLRREKRSNEAALKYVLLGAFSSGILAYGFSILYGLSGATNIGAITAALAQRDKLVHVVALSQLPGAQGEQMRLLLQRNLPLALNFDPFVLQLLPILAFVLVAVGLFFKVAAVPFHQWAPDVYEGDPTPITAYISVASKTASFALLLRLLLTVFWPVRVDWEMLIAAVALASLTLGNLAAITQTNVKRMLAYSSISHVGYILLGIVAAASSPLGFITGMKGVAFYLFVYGFMTIGAFAVLIVLQRQGIVGDELDDLNGLYRRSPISALMLLIFMLSLAGIPPLAGFVGKYFILQALIETGHNRLALFGALYIVPALYYYFRIVMHAYLYEPGNAPLPIITIGQRIAFAVMCFVTVAAGVYPEPFVRLATYSLFFPSGFSGH